MTDFEQGLADLDVRCGDADLRRETEHASTHRVDLSQWIDDRIREYLEGVLADYRAWLARRQAKQAGEHSR